MAHINEWEALSTVKKLDYYLTFYGQAFMFSSFGTVIVGLLLDEIFKNNFFLSPLHIILVAGVTLISLIWRHKIFQEAIFKSKERTKEENYRKMLGIN